MNYLSNVKCPCHFGVSVPHGSNLEIIGNRCAYITVPAMFHLHLPNVSSKIHGTLAFADSRGHSQRIGVFQFICGRTLRGETIFHRSVHGHLSAKVGS